MDRLVLIFLIDALGRKQAADPEFLGRPFLPSLERERAPVRSVLGYSSAAIPTLMTGVLPQEHGHFSMYRVAQGNGVFRPWGPVLQAAVRLKRGSWRVRRLLSRSLRLRGITGYFSLYNIPLELLPRFDLCQRFDLYAPRAFPGRTALPDLLRFTEGDRIWNWSVPSARAFAEMEAEIRRGRARVLFLYDCEFDALMHAHGPEGEAARRALAVYEEKIGRLVGLAREKGREPRVFVFGDHGMAPVRRAHPLQEKLAGLRWRTPRDYLLFLDSTMARFWYYSDAAGREIDELLAGESCGRILSDDELRTLGAFFPRREYGERIFLLNEGEIISPSFVAEAAVAGMHGYHPDESCSSTTLLTNVQDRPYPRDLCELHQLLAREIREVWA